jgi:hypothetical protein
MRLSDAAVLEVPKSTCHVLPEDFVARHAAEPLQNAVHIDNARVGPAGARVPRNLQPRVTCKPLCLRHACTQG